MSSTQEQKRRDLVEAEIKRLERLVDANANPKLLDMTWLKDVNSGEFKVILHFFTESFVWVVGKGVCRSLRHELHIDIPASYPDNLELTVKIASDPLFHPNFPLSGALTFKKRDLESTVLRLWDLFTFQSIEENRNSFNRDALERFKAHRLKLTNPSRSLRRPSFAEN